MLRGLSPSKNGKIYSWLKKLFSLDLIERFNLDDMKEKLNPEMSGFTWRDAKNAP